MSDKENSSLTGRVRRGGDAPTTAKRMKTVPVSAGTATPMAALSANVNNAASKIPKFTPCGKGTKPEEKKVSTSAGGTQDVGTAMVFKAGVTDDVKELQPVTLDLVLGMEDNPPQEYDPFGEYGSGSKTIGAKDQDPAPQTSAGRGQASAAKPRPGSSRPPTWNNTGRLGSGAGRPTPIRRTAQQKVAVESKMLTEHRAAHGKAIKSWQFYNQALKELKQAYKEKVGELGKAEQDLAKSLAEKASVEVNVQLLKAELGAITESSTEKISSLSALKEDLENQVSSLQVEVSEMTGRVKEVENEKEALDTKVAEIKAQVDLLQRHNRGLEDDKARSHDQLAKSQEENTKLAKERQELQTEYFVAQRTISDERIAASKAKEEMLANEKQLNQAKFDLARLEGELKLAQEKLQMEVSEKAAVIQKKDQELAELKDQFDKEQERLERMTDSARTTELELKGLQVSEREAAELAQALKQKVQMLEAKLDVVANGLERAERDNSQKDGLLQTCNDEILRLRMQIDRQQTAAESGAEQQNSAQQQKINELISSALADNFEKKAKDEIINQQKLTLEARETKLKELSEQLVDITRKYKDGTLKERELKNQIQDLMGNVLVYCRGRPLLKGEKAEQEGVGKVIDFPNEVEGREVRLAQPSGNVTYKFDKAFPPEATQEEVFTEVAQVVQSCLDGCRAAIMSYGQTGSGKTYTMVGSMEKPEDWGIIPRAVNLLFETKALMEEIHGWKYTLVANFIEVYNDEINDLLDGFPNVYKAPDGSFYKRPPSWTPGSTDGHILPGSAANVNTAAGNAGRNNPQQNLRRQPPAPKTGREKILDEKRRQVRENYGDVWVEDIWEVELTTLGQAMELVEHAAKNRAVGRTDMNEHSSRSHSDFVIGIRAERPRPPGPDGKPRKEILSGSLHLLDLAGAERLKESGAIGAAKLETSNINASLSNLGLIFSSLRRKEKVPWRSCKLTHMLKAVLDPEKNGKCMMIMNVSPAATSASQSKVVLDFGKDVNSTQLGQVKKFRANVTEETRNSGM